jgi:cell division protein FtsI (penicillin-binding protein 3)
MNFFGLLLIMSFAAFLAKLVYVQIISHEYYAERARSQHTARLELRARRGSIFDSRGRLLAVSLDRRSFFVDPPLVSNKLNSAKMISASLGMSPNDVLARLLKKDTNFVWLKRRLGEEESREALELGLRGLGYVEEPERTYPEGGLAAHVLGIVGDDGIGLEGIEHRFDKYLAGKNGFAMVRADGKRRRIISSDAGVHRGKPGNHLVLTIDAAVQQILEEELDAAMAKWDAASASGIVISPVTGEVLALANRPGYAPGNFIEYGQDVRRDRAVTDFFEPGSVFKPFTAAAVLQEKLLGLDDLIYCENGSWAAHGRVLRDHKPFGELSFRDVIVRSSNIGAAKLGLMLGKDRLYNYLSLFGFGEKTGIEVDGETTGILRPRKEWTEMSVMSAAIGHEVATNVVQLARAYCAIANGGLLLRPHLVKAIVSSDGKVVKQTSVPEVIRRVLRPEVAAMVRGVLTKVVEEGTGRNAQVEGFDVAGKTGTAQKINEDGTYSHSDFVASFVGFAPASRPEVCVVVTIDEPRGAYYGGTVAAPVVGRVVKRSLSYLGVEPAGEEEKLSRRSDADING